MITEEKIKAALVAELDGKEYQQYNQDSQVQQVVRALLDAEGLDSKNFWCRQDKQTVDLTYKQHKIGEVKVKKLKGKKHSNWFGSYCDWSYKDFEVELWSSDDIGGCFAKVNEKLVAEKTAADDRQTEAIEFIRKAIEATGKSASDIRCLCNYIDKNYYTLSTLI